MRVQVLPGARPVSSVVEQWSLKPLVGGPNPPRVTKGRMAELVDARDLKSLDDIFIVWVQIPLRPLAGRSSAGLERYVWDVEVVRSNRIAPTKGD